MVCANLRDALLAYTDGAELVSASFAAGQSRAATDVLARLTQAAADAGVEGAHAELVARTVIHYVLGFTADEQSRLQWDAAGASCQTSSRCSPTTRRAGSASGCSSCRRHRRPT